MPTPPEGLLAIGKEGDTIFQNYPHPDRFGELLGYSVGAVDRDSGSAVVTLTARAEHLSPSGRVHGGVISSLLDYACGIAVCSTLGPHEVCSTVEIKVSYFRPIRLGDDLEAVAQVAFRGKRLCALVATLKRKGDIQPVAMASATFNVVENGGGDDGQGK